MDQASMSHLYLSQDIKQNVLLSFYLESWWCLNFKIFLGSSSKAMANREKKSGRWKYKKFEYLEDKKNFLD